MTIYRMGEKGFQTMGLIKGFDRFIFVILRMKPRALHLVGKCSPSEILPL